MLDHLSHRWEHLYNQVPLCDVPRHFGGTRHSPFMLRYYANILQFCPPGSRTLETGVGSGYGAIWLSLRGVQAEGIDYAPGIVERAKQVNSVLGGSASFRVGDLFHLYAPETPRYSVIHHQGVLEHFTAPQIQAALAQQVAMADRVVFSVPSVYYPFEPEFGDERLLPLEEWQRLLAPFDIEELTLYGDPQHGEREHVLAVLRGQPVTAALRARMTVPAEPYLEGVSAIVHTRNEARHIADCLQTLQGWTDEIIVCDMESEDDTVEIASRFTDQILAHPRIPNFDRARNVSALRACHRWVFYLDADERVPQGLGPALRDLIARQGDTFEAVLLPFRHLFTGHWMQCLYPGYTAPRLFRNGKFLFNTRLHSGAIVDGRTVCFPADNPDLALVHYSFDSLAHYLDKLNRYTDGEALNMHRDGAPFHWQHAIRHFVDDFQGYYDKGRAHQDGVHGFLWSFLSAFYRFEQHAKLFEHRFREQRLTAPEVAVPSSVREILRYALDVAEQEPLPQAPAIRVDASQQNAARFVWSGPLLDPSGYGEESRHLVFAAEEAGVPLAIQPLPWSKDPAPLTPLERTHLAEMTERAVAPGFIHVIHNFAPGFGRHPDAGVCIGRTLFETDRLPLPWVQACNRMDYVWVATEFNRQTFADAGVSPEKLVVIPECFDPTPYQQPAPTTALGKELRQSGKFVFLTVFDWTRHKGWDVLLRGFLEAFERREDVLLVLKVWSTMGYSDEQIREQATALIRETLGRDLASDPRIRWVQERLSQEEMRALYQASDAFVLPSRGEGWGRPYMEAMACGLPTIGTNWSGNTAFMNEDNSFLLPCTIEDVPEVGWREISTYKGHRWAEPDRDHLKSLLLRVVEERAKAQAVGKRGQEYVTTHCNREVVGKLVAKEIARLEALRRPSLALVETKTKSEGNGKSAPRASKKKPTPAVPDAPSCAAPLTVRFEGAQFLWHSLAHVNRELCLGLLGTERVELSLVPNEPTQFAPETDLRFPALASRAFAPLSRPADIHIRHFFPPRLTPPDEGKFVLIQPWEYGYLPQRWIEPIQQNVDEVWCYSEYVKTVYLNSGIPEDKVHVVSLGVDTRVFQPSAPPYVFTTEPGAASLQGRKEPFVFLFVGGTLHRKGIDILLEAYHKAFSAYDEVCLVIKDTGTQTVYYKQNERDRILGMLGDTSRPPIVYLEDDLLPHQLAGLYTHADILVQPYRGEGFCLPALEAMACGCPVLVPEGGPTDDFVDETVGWRMEAAHKPFGNGRIGEWDCVGPTWQFEVSPETLGRQMRQVYTQRDEVKKRGKKAIERVQAGWTWEHTTQAALKRLEALAAQSPSRSVAHPEVKTAPGPAKEKHKDAETPIPTVTPKGVKVTDRRAKAKPQLTLSSEKTEAKPIPRRTAPTISLCMIVKNEERVLGDCLKSAKPWVDEIIIVDTGSTDRTVEIAEEAGAKVFHFPWCDDFSAARNVSLDHGTGDWLFWMDADDTLPKECGRKMREIIAVAEDRVTGYLMQVHIPPAPGDTGFTIVDHVKLFRNRPELRFVRRIHEQILEPIYKSGGMVERTDLYVVHSGYDYSPEGQKRKRERDLTILALELEERPGDAFTLFNIGMTAHHLREFDKAIGALEHCLAVSAPHESTVRKVYAMLASCHLEKGELEQAQRRVEEGLALTPLDPELLFRAGIIHRERGDLAAAERSYRTLLTERESGHIDSLDVSMTGFKAYHNLALIYQDMGRMHEAEATWQAAVQDSPQFVPSWLGLGELYLRLRRFDDVRQVVSKLMPLAPQEAGMLQQRLIQARGEA